MREPPGGKQNLRIFPEELEEEDALSLAPPRDGGSGIDVEVERMERMRLHVEQEEDLGAKIEDAEAGSAAKAGAGAAARESNPPEGFRPTRNVRQGKRLRISDEHAADVQLLEERRPWALRVSGMARSWGPWLTRSIRRV